MEAYCVVYLGDGARGKTIKDTQVLSIDNFVSMVMNNQIELSNYRLSNYFITIMDSGQEIKKIISLPWKDFQVAFSDYFEEGSFCHRVALKEVQNINAFGANWSNIFKKEVQTKLIDYFGLKDMINGN